MSAASGPNCSRNWPTCSCNRSSSAVSSGVRRSANFLRMSSQRRAFFVSDQSPSTTLSRLHPGSRDIPFDKRVGIARAGILDAKRLSSAFVESMLQFVAERRSHASIIPGLDCSGHAGSACWKHPGAEKQGSKAHTDSEKKTEKKTDIHTS